MNTGIVECKDKQLTPDQLQKQATEAYLKNEGSKMIIDQNLLRKVQEVATEERKKATEPTPDK